MNAEYEYSSYIVCIFIVTFKFIGSTAGPLPSSAGLTGSEMDISNPFVPHRQVCQGCGAVSVTYSGLAGRDQI